MRNLCPLWIIFLLTASCFAADGKPVSYKSGDETVNAILYTPPGKGPFPGMVVIHEWWGLNDWVKDQASKLADQGYVALAIDLYRGKVATTPEMAHEIMRGVPAIAPTATCMRLLFLQSQPNVTSRIGAIGWCMGGGYALDLALRSQTDGRCHHLRPSRLRPRGALENPCRHPGNLRRPGSGHSPRRRQQVRGHPKAVGQENRHQDL